MFVFFSFRNEISGALTGLTRVRRFQQDDAHIFCRPDQIRQEIMVLNSCAFYSVIDFYISGSTAPTSFLNIKFRTLGFRVALTS